jgi:ubiquinone/menaquinone biosynthesis C-methylase UbiE
MQESEATSVSDHDHEGNGYATGEKADYLEDPIQYRYLSAEEVYALLDPEPDWTIADLGSGTGFFTDVVAPLVDKVYAVDLHEAMHNAYREKGVPENVELVTSDVSDMPFDDTLFDAALSLRTFHHGVEDSLDEIKRVLRPSGRFVVVDWSATGAGERNRGPDREECFDLATAQSLLLEAGFEIRSACERRETFAIVSRRRE